MTDIDSVGGPSAEEQDKEKKKEKEFHFIAVAHRTVKGFVGVYHYSLQYWKTSSEVILKNIMKEKDIKNAMKLGSIELLRDNSGWHVWAYLKKHLFTKENIWKIIDVSISVIHCSDTSPKFSAIYKGTQQNVKAKWDIIAPNDDDKKYNYAEQGGFDGNFLKWPNSKYQLPLDIPFNNSNTFVRKMVSDAGLTMHELPGLHPGANRPSQIPNIYSEKPWREGQEAPPAPTTTP